MIKSIEPKIESFITIDGQEKNIYRFLKKPFHAYDNYLKFDKAGNIININEL